jgi:hypothetical protein
VAFSSTSGAEDVGAWVGAGVGAAVSVGRGVGGGAVSVGGGEVGEGSGVFVKGTDVEVAAIVETTLVVGGAAVNTTVPVSATGEG